MDKKEQATKESFNLLDPKVLDTIITNQYDVLDDVSPPTEVDNGRQGSLPQRGGHPDVSRDVSPSLDADNVARELSLSKKIQIFRELSFNKETEVFTETQERRQEDKEVTQLCNTALVHSAAR